MKKNNQEGFSAVAGLLVIVVLALIGFAGWRVLGNQEANNTEQTTSSEQQNDAPEVNDEQDLEEAENYLDDQDIDGELDTSDIDQSLNQ
ncbi:hypothetical protein BH23PAT1_BH23PAT1_2750 [soil metagenome]